MKQNTNQTKTLSFEDITKLKIRGYYIWASINSAIKLATSNDSKARLRHFIRKEYPNHLPELADVERDLFFEKSFNFYTEDSKGNVTSTVSLVMDNPNGLPEEELFSTDIASYRNNGMKCIQIGRFINTEQDENKTLKEYFRLFYLFSRQLGFDILLGLVKQKDMAFHRRKTSGKILNQDTGISFGSGHIFGTALWDLNDLDDNFFRWVGEQPIASPGAKNQSYSASDWNPYARVFGSVQTRVQHELQHAAVKPLHGDVVDCGSGCSKLAGLLSDRTDISGYVGIDCSEQMIELANWYIGQFEKPNYSTFLGRIEDFHERLFDSAVSLNSFYAWPNPKEVLSHIYDLLKPGGTFVLGTLNPALDLFKIDKEERKELIFHPDYQEFREHNLSIVENDAGNYLEMDDLVELLRSVGFKLMSCHQEFYLGGLNFVVMKK